MSSSAGWYPDPGGQPGMYRYWTGSAWTEAITANPQGTPPPVPPGGPASAQGGYGATGYPPGTGGRRRNLGWWIGGLAALVAVALVVVLVVRGLGGAGGPVIALPGQPNPTVTPNICPPASSTDATEAPAPSEPGWVSGGKLAFPRLGDPWQEGVDNRVPWGALASVLEVLDQASYDGGNANWVASILVSDLFVGDGFASTKVASETVLKCVLGKYYADTVVTQTPISSARHDVDGHSGWLIETQLSFDIPGLNAKGERVLLLVVQTSDDDYGLFYASIPDTRTELLPDARKALAGLRVRS